LYLISGVNIA